MLLKNKILIIFLSILLTVLVSSFHYREKNKKDLTPKSAYFVKEWNIGRVNHG